VIVDLKGLSGEVVPDVEMGFREGGTSEEVQDWIAERARLEGPRWARSATLILLYTERSGLVPTREAAWKGERYFMAHFLCVYHEGLEGFVPMPEPRTR